MNESFFRELIVFRLPCNNLPLSLSDFLFLHLLPNGLYSISPGLNVVVSTTLSSFVCFFGCRPLRLIVKSICDSGSMTPALSV